MFQALIDLLTRIDRSLTIIADKLNTTDPDALTGEQARTIQSGLAAVTARAEQLAGVTPPTP